MNNMKLTGLICVFANLLDFKDTGQLVLFLTYSFLKQLSPFNI